jgi:hypothetical protein
MPSACSTSIVQAVAKLRDGVSAAKIAATLSCVVVVSSCSATTTAPPSSASPPTSTTSPSSTGAPGVATSVLPVVPCHTSFGAQPSHPFVPRQLPTATPARGVSFYSNGLLTVLAPAGWACGALVAADGAQRLDAYPPGQPDASVTPSRPGAAVVQLDSDYTGHGPGAQLVCPLFPQSPAATFLRGVSPPCPSVPSAEITARLTDDVITFRDPSGVRGTGAGSGGPLLSTGAAVYPQAGPAEPPGGVTVALLSCTLPDDVASVCQAIQADFLVRYSPRFSGAPGA